LEWVNLFYKISPLFTFFPQYLRSRIFHFKYRFCLFSLSWSIY
ncbi:hypothetical protein T12_15774, partial [Trichinella patagoniensis]